MVEARLVLLAPARFLVEATLVFLLAAFLVLFLAPREVRGFLEVDRPLLDFLATAPLRAFVVGILSSVNAHVSSVILLDREGRAPIAVLAGFPANGLADEPAVFATKQRPFIAEEALPVVDYALVFPPGLLKKTGEVGNLLLFRQTLN